MEVKPGYKQTEVGVIPEEWEVSSIGQQSQIFGRIGFRGYTVDDIVKEGSGAIAINPSNVQDGKTVFDKCTYISWQKYEESPEIKIDEGDIILVKTGSTFGKTAMVKNLPGKATLNPQVIVFKKVKASPGFFGYMMGFPTIQSQITAAVVGGALPTLSQKLVAAFKMPLPPSLPEQRAIAEALSDVDGLLGGLDRLIAKKRDLKQAAMQQLLTGQTRLPGFHGEWEVKRLGELGSTYGGLTGKTKSDFGEGSGRYITFMNVMSNVVIDCGTFEQVNVSSMESQNRAMKGDLFFNGSSETPEEVAMCAVLLQNVRDVYLNSFCFGFRFKNGAEADGLFLAYYLRSKEGRELMKSLAQGSTRYNLSKVALLKSPLRLPSVAEQAAIAEVLSEMDGELGKLEERREKTRALKQAMMQELLTGRTRLV